MHVAILGDSIAHGFDDTEIGGWVTRLKKLSMDKGMSDLVFNLGIPGDTSGCILKRADAEIKQRQPFLNKVVYSVGTNDIGKKVSLKDFRKNLNQLGDIAKSYQNRVFFMELFLLVKNEKIVDNSRHNMIIQEICHQHEFTFIPTVDLIKESDLSDGCHPSPIGHIKLSQRVAQYLEN